jgi:hypothetical protein
MIPNYTDAEWELFRVMLAQRYYNMMRPQIPRHKLPVFRGLLFAIPLAAVLWGLIWLLLKYLHYL